MNTLITKLTDAVTDNTIRRLTEAVFETASFVSDVDKKAIGIATDEAGLIRCPDGHMYYNNSGTPGTVPLPDHTLSGSGSLVYWWFGTPGCHIMISPKAAITKLAASNSALNGDFKELAYSERINELVLGSESVAALTGSIENINQTSLDNISIFTVRGPGVTGNIECLSSNTSLTEFNVPGSDISGNLLELGHATSLTRIRFHGTQIVGTMDDLADELYANGKVSGTVQYIYNSSGSATVYTFTAGGWSKS